MSTKVEAPKPPQPTAAQQEAEKENLALIKEMRAERELFKPFYYQELGLTETPEGELRKLTEEERIAGMSESDKMEYQNRLRQQERLTRALEGELPLSEGTIQRKGEELKELNERLTRVGSTGTVRQRAMDLFQRRWAAIEDAERRGEISTGTSAVLQRMGVTSDIGARRGDALRAGDTGGLQLAGAYGRFSQPTGFQQMAFQTGLQSSQNRSSLMGDIGSLAGTVGGMALGGPMGASMGGNIGASIGGDLGTSQYSLQF